MEKCSFCGEDCDYKWCDKCAPIVPSDEIDAEIIEFLHALEDAEFILEK